VVVLSPGTPPADCAPVVSVDCAASQAVPSAARNSASSEICREFLSGPITQADFSNDAGTNYQYLQAVTEPVIGIAIADQHFRCRQSVSRVDVKASSDEVDADKLDWRLHSERSFESCTGSLLSKVGAHAEQTTSQFVLEWNPRRDAARSPSHPNISVPLSSTYTRQCCGCCHRRHGWRSAQSRSPARIVPLPIQNR